MKNYNLKKIISILLICAIIVPFTTLAGAVTQEEINKEQDKKAELAKQIEEIKNEINNLNKDKANIESYVKELDKKMSQFDIKINNLNTQITDKQTQIDESVEQLAIAQADSEQQYEAMKLRIKYMYEHNSESYISTILSSQNMGDLLNKAEYVNKLSQYDRKMMTRYMETEQLIADTKVQLEVGYQELVSMKDDVEIQKAAFQVVQESKVSELNALNKNTKDAEDYSKKLEGDYKEEENAIKKMEAELAAELAAQKDNNNNNGPSYNGGMFIWPTPSTRITSHYGDTEDRGAPHQGLDIGAQVRGVSGDPIYAAYDGIVTLSEYSGSAGNWIMISHGNGLFTVYMHNSALLITKGQTVTKGQKIALMGTSGSSTGVHLHFAVRLNGVYVNPMPYLGK